MWIWVCFLYGKTVYNLLGTSQYVVVEGLGGNPSNGRPPTEAEKRDIEYHCRYMSQLLGGRDGSQNHQILGLLVSDQRRKSCLG